MLFYLLLLVRVLCNNNFKMYLIVCSSFSYDYLQPCSKFEFTIFINRHVHCKHY